MAIMESTKSLFNKIKNRIQSNPVFSKSIYYPSSTHIKDVPTIQINQDGNKIYVCAYMYITYGVLNDYELTKEFLSPYSYHKVLRVHCGLYVYKVIYELSLS